MTKLYNVNHQFIQENNPIIYRVFGVGNRPAHPEPVASSKNLMLEGIKKTNPRLYERLTKKTIDIT